MLCNIRKKTSQYQFSWKPSLNLLLNRMWKNTCKCVLDFDKNSCADVVSTLFLSHTTLSRTQTHTAAVVPTISKRGHDWTLDALDKPDVFTQRYFAWFWLIYIQKLQQATRKILILFLVWYLSVLTNSNFLFASFSLLMAIFKNKYSACH